MQKRKAVFLDRDGVINKAIIKEGKPYPPQTLAELVIPEDVLPALTVLKARGYLLIGATNQPDVVRGKTERSLVEAINAQLMQSLPLDEIRVCYHDDADDCACRKPAPGLLLQAAQDWTIDLAQSYMIGDRWRDVEAGQKAGCKTIWLNNSYSERGPKQEPDCIATSFKAAADFILEMDLTG